MALVLGVEMSALSTKVEVRDADDGKTARLGTGGADEVAEAWGVGAAREVEPDPRVDAEAIRADYASAR